MLVKFGHVERKINGKKGYILFFQEGNYEEILGYEDTDINKALKRFWGIVKEVYENKSQKEELFVEMSVPKVKGITEKCFNRVKIDSTFRRKYHVF